MVGIDVNRAGELAVFEAAARAGSFSGAARVLDLTPSAVSRTVARTEARLGVRLVIRTTRSLTLTAEGEAQARRGGELIAQEVQGVAEPPDLIPACLPGVGDLRIQDGAVVHWANFTAGATGRSRRCSGRRRRGCGGCTGTATHQRKSGRERDRHNSFSTHGDPPLDRLRGRYCDRAPLWVKLGLRSGSVNRTPLVVATLLSFQRQR